MVKKTRSWGVVLLVASICVSTAWWIGLRYGKPFKGKWDGEKQVWMNVFIHGSFAVPMTFLSANKVIKDDLKGSPYRKVTKRMRKDAFFFKDQPMLERGLVRVMPVQDPALVNYHKYAVYPLIQTYQEVAQAIKPQGDENVFYTFGWSGLMSQQRRRNEAIRLYNELCQQCAQLRAQGFMPRVRLIAHSHGGNVCLNLAAINYVLHSKRVDVGAEIKNTAERASLEAMLERIRSLPSKELVPVMRGSRKFDYVPDYKQLVVDELVLFGTPVQPETAAFLFYDTFKKVYHFYSDKDSIQGLDFVTTRQLFSDQRIPLVRGLKDDCVVKNKDSYVVQARIMVDRSLKQNPKKTTADAHDPCHKDFWFFAWEAPELFFAPLPVVAFTPLLCAAIEQQREKKCDLDVSMLLRKQRVKVSVRPYQGKSVRAKVYLSANAFERVKVHANLWRPVNTGLNHELHAAYKHLTLS